MWKQRGRWLSHWTTDIVLFPNVCQFVLTVWAHLWALIQQRIHWAASFLFCSPHPSGQRCHQRAGGSRWLCVKLCPLSSTAVCPCAGHRALAPDEKSCFFLSTSSLGWLVCQCVHWAWRAARKLLHMPALPKPSGLCFYSMSCSSEMIFIPLGILDKFCWPPLTNHILGLVSLTLARDCIIFYQKAAWNSKLWPDFWCVRSCSAV